MKLADNLKRWIVNKLGGVLYKDLSYEMQMKIVERLCKQRQDYYSHAIFESAFPTKYEKN